MVSCELGVSVGSLLGLRDGSRLKDGRNDGALLGRKDGALDGVSDGELLEDGCRDGSSLGR